MKRFSILLLALLATATTLSAANSSNNSTQGRREKRSITTSMEWGLTACASYNTLEVSNTTANISAKPHIGYGVGLNIGIKFGRFFAIQPEINYIHAKLRLDAPQIPKKHNSRIETNTVDIPVLLSLRLANIIRINAGPVFTVMNNCFYTDPQNERAMFGNTKPSFGYCAGAAIVLRNRFMIDARYIGYFNSSLHSFNGIEFDGKYQTIAIKLGYIF